MTAVLLGSYLVSLGFVAVSSAPVRLDEPSSRRPKNPEEFYLRNYGYLTMGSRGDNETDESFREALQKYQKAFGLNVTGEVNTETLERMGVPRCGVSDDDGPIINRRKRFSTFGTKWPQKRISYAIEGNCTSRSREFLRDAVVRAFKIWSDVTPLDFYETTPPRALIVIGCKGREHGDGAPFDGPGQTLAHAFAPPIGTTHFDADELWTMDSTGMNMYQVATHELGHALGLGHSSELEAVMFQFYGYKDVFTLHQDDILGIQSLYGSRNSPLDIAKSPSTTPTTSTLKKTTIAIRAGIPTWVQ